MEIIGNVDKDRLFCTGSLTKLLTTFVILSFLAEKYDLHNLLNDEDFFDKISENEASKEFLHIFQKTIGSKFTLHDLCSHYTGLPYTFDPSEEELEKADCELPFKHHSIMDENTFLHMCKTKITQVYKNRCKFHYSELSIIFLGYFIEKAFNLKIEELYEKYLLKKFNLKNSVFSRTIPENTFIQDLSDHYDYPAIAILDHGYFAYGNGFYTTLNDMRKIIESLLPDPIFAVMTDVHEERAASSRLMDGLSVEMRLVDGDLIYGYEGLSFSCCNLWAYSTKQKKGFLTTNNSEEKIYDIVYGQLGYTEFNNAPKYSERFYLSFMKHYDFHIEPKDIPAEFQGQYHRVLINTYDLKEKFEVGKDFIVIRNPDKIKYHVIYVNGNYCIESKDHVHGASVKFYKTDAGNRYMFYEGTLYCQI